MNEQLEWMKFCLTKNTAGCVLTNYTHRLFSVEYKLRSSTYVIFSIVIWLHATNSKLQGPSAAVESSSAGQDCPIFYGNKSSLPSSKQPATGPDSGPPPTLESCTFKINCNITLSYVFMSPEWYFTFKFSKQKFLCNLYRYCACYMLRPFLLLKGSIIMGL
jgi:hypothetical protein